MRKVVWGEGKFTSQPSPGHYRSFSELLQKSERLRAEQEQAQAYLQKAFPAMLKLLEMRLTSGQPLIVMRPLRYQTAVLKSSMEDEIDRSFYNTGGSNESDRFIDRVLTINPGTQLVLKSLDPTLREFVFVDGSKKEHAISYDDRNALMTQTDVFETVRQLFESKGDR